MKNSIRLQIKFVNLVLLIFLMFCNFLMGQIRVNQDSVTVTDEKYFFNGNLLTSNVYVLFENQQLKNEFLVLKGLKNGQSIFYVKKENFDKNKYLDTFLVERYQNQIELLLEQFDNLRKDSIGLKTTFDDLFNNKIGGLDKFYDLEEKNNKGKLKGEKKENYDNYFVFKNKIEENKKELLSIRSELSSVNLKLNQEKGKSVFEHTKSELITFKDNNKNGLYEKYEKSKIIETGNYSNNQKNGEWKTYDSYGKLTKLETYIENKKNGKFQEFQNDKLVTEGNYKDNLKEGEWKFYDYYGKLSVLENYKQDKLEGLSKKYSGDIIIEEGQYVGGLMNGEWVFRYDNGNLKGKGKYINGDGGDLSSELKIPKKGRDGLWINYHENGNKSQGSTYKNGVLSGKSLTYYQNGNLYTSGVYVDGNIEGDYSWFYDNGKLDCISVFKSGKENGSYKSYYESGKIKQESTKLNGEYSGLSKTYYENGNLKTIGTYVNGKIDGNYKWYREDGTLETSSEFNIGDPISQIDYDRSGNKIEKEDSYSSNNARSNSTYTKVMCTGWVSQVDQFSKGYAVIVNIRCPYCKNVLGENSLIRARVNYSFGNQNYRECDEDEFECEECGKISIMKPCLIKHLKTYDKF